MAGDLKQAIALIEAGEDEAARACLVEILKAEPKNDAAWVWMSTVVETEKLRLQCLKEALKHNPRNKAAREALGEGGGRRKGQGGRLSVAGFVLCSWPVLVAAGVGASRGMQSGAIAAGIGLAAAVFNLGVFKGRLPALVRIVLVLAMGALGVSAALVVVYTWF